MRGLLDITRQRHVSYAPVSIAQVVARVKRDIGPQLARTRVTVTTQLAADLPKIHADATGLEQVIANLLANSLEALPPDGHIEIEALRDGPQHVLLRCSDDGPGVAAALRERVFDPFFTTKSAQRSAGLGLAISQRIVRAHGGSITTSTRIDGGRGACFVVRLPVGESTDLARRDGQLAATPAHTAAIEPPSRDAPRVEPPSPRVLLVDDEAPVRELLRRYLSGHGFVIREAENSAAALALLDSTEPIDVLVTDLRMPGMSGIELLERVQSRWPELATRAIAITGDVVAPEVARFIQRRAFPLLEKPIDFARLLAEVSAAARRVTPPDRPGADATRGRSPAP